jgi:hypothetical protein
MERSISGVSGTLSCRSRHKSGRSDVARDGRVVFMTIHQANHAFELSGRAVLMRNGAITAEGCAR